MKRNNFVLLLIFIPLLLSSCASSGGFARYQGAARKLPVAIFAGNMPDGTVYQDLGEVSGRYQRGLLTDTTGSCMYSALSNMADNAKAIGANAVVETKLSSSGLGSECIYQGRAVVMQEVPEK